MKHSHLLTTLQLTYFALHLLLIPLSWIGEIYGWGTQSLLGNDGLSWLITQLLPTVRTAPWAEIALILCTISLLIESGLARALRHHNRNLRERTALQATAITILLSLLLVGILWLTHSPLLFSALATFRGSPIQQSLFTLLLLWLCLLAIIHGIALGRLLSLSDFIQAATALPKQAASLIISLPLTALLTAALCYAFPPLAFMTGIPHILYTLIVIATLIDCKCTHL